MSYHFSKIVEKDFDAAIVAVTAALQAEGFGVLTEIDLKATLHKKLALTCGPTGYWALAIRALPTKPCRPRSGLA